MSFKKFFNNTLSLDFAKLDGLFSNVVGIDLGTANTVAYLHGKGVVVNEPTILAYNTKTNQIIAFGKKARNMLGRVPQHIELIQPLSKGIVADFEGAEEILRFIFNKLEETSARLLAPHVVIGVPSKVSDIEIQILKDVTMDSGARSIHIVSEPYAVAVGLDLINTIKHAFMIIDIGGGTTDIMIFYEKNMIASASIHVAGKLLDSSIVKTLQKDFNLVIGEKTVDELKIRALSSKPDSNQQFSVCGRDTKTNLPRESIISERHIRTSIYPQIKEITQVVYNLISNLSPELSADFRKGKIYLAGGGALLKGFPELLEKNLGIPVVVADEPLTVMAKGAAKIVHEKDQHLDAFLEEGDTNWIN